MDAVEYFPDDLVDILDLATEKEVRIRVPLEELELLLENARLDQKDCTETAEAVSVQKIAFDEETQN